MAASVFPLADLFDAPPPRLKVVDVGALPVEGSREIYQDLLDRGLAEVVAFEPDAALCAELNAGSTDARSFLPHVVGDGTEATFRQCKAAMTSSIFEPNMPLLEKFQNLAEYSEVVSREPVTTIRLDDLDAVRDADFLKMDVQGAEVAVIEGANAMLRGVTVVHTEVVFVPLYEGQPLFAEVDQALRREGFLFHKFLGFAGRAFKPMIDADRPNASLSQQLWGEAVYIKDFMAFDRLEPPQLLAMAVVLHEVYQSVDLVLQCLIEWDRRTGSKVAMEYQGRLVAG